jgi:hypothetical protein
MAFLLLPVEVRSVAEVKRWCYVDSAAGASGASVFVGWLSEPTPAMSILRRVPAVTASS